MQSTLPTEKSAISPMAPAAAPDAGARALPQSAFAAAPPHTHTESTLAPTSEFMRYVLAALPSRYVFRGMLGLGLNEKHDRPPSGFAKHALNFLGKPGEWIARRFGMEQKYAKASAYNASLGIGSLLLTIFYSATVYKDIKNIFSETVAGETGKPVDRINIFDIMHSENRIVQKTLENFRNRTLKRLLVDALFVPSVMIQHESAGDTVLGLKGAQLFAETWKRKTTMFEDLVSFVNHKINPYNGLGQPIGLGEIFDLYQHYSQQFHPDRAFSNVLERSHTESVLWARNEPIFQRITELMNQTYAYKHPTILDPKTGDAVIQANFTLPIFIHLLGFDLIDTHQPERTQIYIEVGNRHGIAGINGMRKMIASGVPLDEVMQHYDVKFPPPPQRTPTPKGNERNTVIPKGSTVQLDAAPEQQQPARTIDAASALVTPRQQPTMHVA
jgi:hypothetical protein